MVSKNGRSFAVLFDSGFRKILQPICDKLNISVNRTNGKNEITKRASQQRAELKKLLPPLFNQKIDDVKIVKVHERSFLEVNTQIIQNRELRIYNLGNI
jgi:hypothetical protein